MSNTVTTSRSLKERIIHACTFEFFAVLFTILLGILVLNKPLSSLGIMAVLISTTALILNIVYNWLFDKVFPF